MDSNRVRQLHDGAKWEATPPDRLLTRREIAKGPFGCIANLCCQAGEPWGATRRPDAEFRVRQEA